MGIFTFYRANFLFSRWSSILRREDSKSTADLDLDVFWLTNVGLLYRFWIVVFRYLEGRMMSP